MKSISVVVPVYHGKKYIRGLIGQIELCKRDLDPSVEVELIFSNDAPDDKLEEIPLSENLEIVVLNTTENRGIHGARVVGLKACRGDYVLFLDQDDHVFPQYLKSQMDKIGDADAVVCRCINENKLHYNADKPFETIITKEYMLKSGNPIVSTGSALIRKRSVPAVWMENIQKHNGADDFLLWLCMAGKNCKFALNQEVLYERVVTGINTSLDTNHMLDSHREMIEILKSNDLFQGEDLLLLNQLEEKLKRERVRLLDKFRKMFYVLNAMLEQKEEKVNLSDGLVRKGYRHIAIYGAGYLGKRLWGELANSEVAVDFFIDRNAEYLTECLPVYTLETAPQSVDAIIVTLVQGEEKVMELLQDRFHGVEILQITEFLKRNGTL